MAAWVTPINWSNGAVSAATMNAEIRDHANWLKNFADLITNSTAADSGAATHIRITRATTAGISFDCKVSGDAGERFRIDATGAQYWGSGGGTPVAMLDYDSTNSTLRIINRVFTITSTSMLKVSSKAGAVTDADIPSPYSGPSTGLMMVDSTNNRLYVKVGSVWRFAALT